MIDRILTGALHLVVMTIITALAAVALACAHWGALRLIGGTMGSGCGLLIAGGASAVAAALLIRYRNDLVDR